VRGAFAPGDSVSLLDPDGKELGRGLARLSAVDAARLAGRKNADGVSVEVVHKDDLVVLPED
jgi:glutamate 5-kinase